MLKMIAEISPDERLELHDDVLCYCKVTRDGLVARFARRNGVYISGYGKRGLATGMSIIRCAGLLLMLLMLTPYLLFAIPDLQDEVTTRQLLFALSVSAVLVPTMLFLVGKFIHFGRELCVRLARPGTVISGFSAASPSGTYGPLGAVWFPHRPGVNTALDDLLREVNKSSLRTLPVTLQRSLNLRVPLRRSPKSSIMSTPTYIAFNFSIQFGPFSFLVLRPQHENYSGPSFSWLYAGIEIGVVFFLICLACYAITINVQWRRRPTWRRQIDETICAREFDEAESLLQLADNHVDRQKFVREYRLVIALLRGEFMKACELASIDLDDKHLFACGASMAGDIWRPISALLRDLR